MYAAKPVEEDMFNWHFTIRGPPATDFEGGIYHGRIILPRDYPFKPPSIMLITPNGRWEVNKKICLSISAYHPEQWQPAWGVRTILEALISFMTTPGDGAVGALDFTPEERRRLARESKKYTHALMPELLPIPESGVLASAPVNNKYQAEIAKMHIVSLEPTKKEDDSKAAKETSEVESGHQGENKEPQQAPEPAPQVEEKTENTSTQTRGQPAPAPNTVRRNAPESGREWSLYIAAILAFGLFVILYRKALRNFRDEL